ncbi:MAG TPA: hypothetical protein PLS63_06370, partial [Microthrixaceae bacterium]|nr:hypothetical protein [Microthrixaceae bacterium]
MDERAQRGITGDHTTDGRPDGFSSITPFLAVPNARDALGFYESVFDAEIGGVTEMQQEAFGQLGLAMVVAVLVVYLIMVATFGSLLQPLILL